MLELVLVRHGETVGQSSIRLYGATDVALAPEGEEQVAVAGRALRGWLGSERSFDRVFTSPLIRAQRSAQVVLGEIGGPAAARLAEQVQVVEDFREVDFGDWEGWTWAEVEARDPDNHRRWAAEGPRFTYPGGESREAFVARVQAAVEPSLGAAFSSGAKRVLCVVHKGVIRAIAARLLAREVSSLGDAWGLPLGGYRRLCAPELGGPWTLSAFGEDPR